MERTTTTIATGQNQGYYIRRQAAVEVLRKKERGEIKLSVYDQNWWKN
jgi:hypothetical protein